MGELKYIIPNGKPQSELISKKADIVPAGVLFEKRKTRELKDRLRNQSLELESFLERTRSMRNEKDDFENGKKLKIQREVRFKFEDGSEEDHTEEIQKEFDYLSRTKDLEWGTDRTRILQDIVDKMLVGRNAGEAKVVIINKMEEAGGFVYPDGTIFISQALINKLDSLDEIGYVLGHEVGHLVHKTSEQAENDNHRKNQKKTGSLGINWSHEIAADFSAPYYLEKVGLSTFGFEGIKKISPEGRGAIHQTGDSRASGMMGLHYVKDFETSAKAPTPIPEELSRECQKSNLEAVLGIFANIKEDYPKLLRTAGYQKIQAEITDKDEKIIFETVKVAISKLHAKDLRDVFGRYLAHQEYAYDENEKKIGAIFSRAFFSFVQERMGKGEEVDFFLSTLVQSRGMYYQKEMQDLLRSQENFHKISNNFDNLVQEKYAEISRIVFDVDFFGISSPLDKHEELPEYVAKNFLEFFSKHLNILNEKFEGKIEWAISVDEESFLEELVKINHSQIIREISSNRFIADILMSYVDLNYLATRNKMTKGEKVEKRKKIKEFFEKAKEKGLLRENGDGARWHHYLLDEKKTERDKTKEIIEGRLFVFPESGMLGKEAFEEIFPEDAKHEEPPLSLEELIKYYKNAVYGNLSYCLRFGQADLDGFLRQAGEVLEHPKLDDKNRREILETVFLQLEKDILENDQNGISETIDHAINKEKIKLNWKLNLAILFFPQDTNEFYEIIEKALNEFAIEAKANNVVFSKEELEKILRPLLFIGNRSDDEKVVKQIVLATIIKNTEIRNNKRTEDGVNVEVKIKNYTRFSELPLIKDLIVEGNKESNFENLEELYNNLEKRLKALLDDDNQILEQIDLFSEKIFNNIFFSTAREDFLKIIQKGIKKEEYDMAYQFIEKYFPNSLFKKNILREINKRYLEFPEVSLADKTEHLIKNYDQIGPEGMVMIAEQIETIDEYIFFKEKMNIKVDDYLNGSKILDRIAQGDAVTAMAGDFLGHSGFISILKTCLGDKKSQKEISTNLAKFWLRTCQDAFKTEETERAFFILKMDRSVSFDQTENKFLVNDEAKSSFKTLREFFEELKSLSFMERAGIVHKLLNDSDGAFSSEEKRNTLGELAVKSLNLKDSFLAELVKKLCIKSEGHYLSFPLCSMLAPLLFSALDENAVDYGEIMGEYKELKKSLENSKEKEKNKNKKGGYLEISRSKLERIMKSSNKKIVKFGHNYRYSPNCPMAKIAKRGDEIYDSCLEKLSHGFLEEDETERERMEESDNDRIKKIDPGLEGLIKAAETNALTTRIMQSSVEMMDFKPEVQERLASCLDSNVLVNKLIFWENLLTRFQNGDQEVIEYIKNIDRIGKKAGAGSLFTTYFATLKNPPGKEVVVKLLNPNALAIVGANYKTLFTALDEIESDPKSSRDNKNLARRGKILNDLGNNWCVGDISYTDFEKDDSDFREVIENFSEGLEGGNRLYAPAVMLDKIKFKSEEVALGTTARKFLEAKDIPSQSKIEAVETLKNFFQYQLGQLELPEFKDNATAIFHSDPHRGNYMINEDSDGRQGIG
ncbi:MAG: M48 family metalloprotease, partial [Candidatus Moraniibacteriota bacterium]